MTEFPKLLDLARYWQSVDSHDIIRYPTATTMNAIGKELEALVEAVTVRKLEAAKVVAEYNRPPSMAFFIASIRTGIARRLSFWRGRND